MICALTGTTRLGLCIYFPPALFLSDLSAGRRLALEKAKGIYEIKWLNSKQLRNVLHLLQESLCTALQRDFAEFSTFYSLYKYLLGSTSPPLEKGCLCLSALSLSPRIYAF